MNIDGAIAAIVSDLGFDWRIGRVFIAAPRAAGLAAHAVEEATRERGWRKIASPEDIDYDGPPPSRHIP
jgi:citrate synthase/citryl-CoA lyase